jgi:recombination protein RecA
MSSALRKLTGAISKSNCIAIFINQLREKIGVTYGNPEVTPGGRALKFYASVRLDVRKIESLKAGGDSVGNRTRVRVVKNKVAPPFKEAEFDIMYGRGISHEGEVLDLAVRLGLVQRSGSWFSIDEQKLGQGRDNAKEYLRANPELLDKLAGLVRENMGKLSSDKGTKRTPVRAGASVDIEVDDKGDN